MMVSKEPRAPSEVLMCEASIHPYASIHPSAWKDNSPKFVVAISEPRHVTVAKYLEGCQPWVSRRRTMHQSA